MMPFVSASCKIQEVWLARMCKAELEEMSQYLTVIPPTPPTSSSFTLFSYFKTSYFLIKFHNFSVPLCDKWMTVTADVVKEIYREGRVSFHLTVMQISHLNWDLNKRRSHELRSLLSVWQRISSLSRFTATTMATLWERRTPLPAWSCAQESSE